MMHKHLKLLVALAALYSGVLNGQSSNSFSKSILPVVSFRLGDFSYAQQFEPRFGEQRNFTLEIKEGNELSIGFLYQLESNKGSFYRLGIENFSISKANSFITNDVPLREVSNSNSTNSFRLVGHLEYGKYFFSGRAEKFRIALGVVASPYTSKYKSIAANSESVDYKLFQHGIKLGLSPRISLKLSSLVEIDLAVVAKLINTNYSSLNYKDPLLTASDREVREFRVSVNEPSLSVLLGLKFNL